MNVSAVVLSAQPVHMHLDGVRVVPHVSSFEDAAGLLDARLAALRNVDTEWFFYLDDDDELPVGYAAALDRCMAVSTPLAYTHELIGLPGARQLRRSAPYSQDAHITDPMLLHHLVVCRTEAALRAAEVIPRGTYAVEPLLFFQVAKEGATLVDEVGYIWNRKPGGLSYHPSLTRGMVWASLWAKENRA